MIYKSPPFIFGTQYYRPPFPDARHWRDDFARIRNAGLNAVQLWLVWGWCEPAPGRFRFEDYDRLTDLAAANGLGLVLSLLPELNPYWLERELPRAAIVDIHGHPVSTCNRWECLSGVVPGACSDHSEVRRRMVAFMETSARHFGGHPNLLAWDCWNENRWCNMAPDFVCFCDESLESFRDYLRKQYGDLDGLGRAWGRRYDRWEHVRPGRTQGLSYPELHDFTGWTAWRATEMAAWRVAAVRAGDPAHPVGTHTGTPTIFGGQNLNEILYSRGIDWDIATGDFYGYSSFPKGANPYPGEDWTLKTAAITQPSVGKPVWMSELQGGPTAVGRVWGAPLTGAEQQAWVWCGVGQGAKAALFWCWRPEVFGLETGGYGIIADDGFAADRLQKLGVTAKILLEKGSLLADYVPDPARIAVVFQRDSNFVGWMHRQPSKPTRAPSESNYTTDNYLAYTRALETAHLPYLHLDDRHLPKDPGALRLAIVPDPLGLDDAAAAWLVEFARGGGTVLIEAGAGMLGPDTFLRSPHDRPFYRLAGLHVGFLRAVTRSPLEIPAGTLGDNPPIVLHLDKYESLLLSDPTAKTGSPSEPPPVLVDHPVGKGRILALSSVVGRLTWNEAPDSLRALVTGAASRAGIIAPVVPVSEGSGFCACRTGTSGTRRLLFVTHYQGDGKTVLRCAPGLVPPGALVIDWAGHTVTVSRAEDSARAEICLPLDTFDWAVLEWKCST